MLHFGIIRTSFMYNLFVIYRPDKNISAILVILDDDDDDVDVLN